MIILFILLPIILIAIGISLISNSVETINKELGKNQEIKDMQNWNKYQKSWLASHPNGTRQQYMAWFLEQKRLGNL